MNTKIIVAVALVLAIPIIGQSGRNGIDSPAEVLRKFLKIELEGARLTMTAPSTTSQFFVEPQSPVAPQIIFIVSDAFDLSELPSEEKTAKISVFFHEYYGKLDSSMRFTPAPKNAPRGGILKKGITSDYTLIATEKPLHPSSNESEHKKNHRPVDWKIAKAQAGPTIDIATAINYVKEVRRKTSEPTDKTNADKTLASLAKLAGGTPK